MLPHPTFADVTVPNSETSDVLLEPFFLAQGQYFCSGNVQN